jgi:hypothetical protein
MAMVVAGGGWAQGTAPVGVRVVSAEARSGNLSHPEYLVDGKLDTEFTFEWANGGASVVLDLGRPWVVEAVRVTNGHANQVVWLREVAVGADPKHLRPLLGRDVNLPVIGVAETAVLPLPPAACRYAKLTFAGGGPTGAVSEATLLGHENRPERHLLCWASDIKRDFLDKMDYLDHDLGVTDVWLDAVASAFTQTSYGAGFDAWVRSGALAEFKRRGIRYWLGEHEAFTTMVNDPEDLRDDLKWETTLRLARVIYGRAKELGFRGIVMDAEDYTGVSEAAKAKYASVADFVDAWCFADEFGFAGQYYQRGLQYGRVVKAAWGGPVMQLYEARIYAGKDDCRAGNYWWLKGIHDAGCEIWIATEKTYGAGKGEVVTEYPEFARRWFVDMAEYMPQVYRAYPFAARVLPGFAPWVSRIGKPNYLPKYLDEQISQAENCAQGYWIYNEGNPKAGDPRDVLDKAFLRGLGVTAEDYLAVFARHRTERGR